MLFLSKHYIIIQVASYYYFDIKWWHQLSFWQQTNINLLSGNICIYFFTTSIIYLPAKNWVTVTLQFFAGKYIITRDI